MHESRERERVWTKYEAQVTYLFQFVDFNWTRKEFLELLSAKVKHKRWPERVCVRVCVFERERERERRRECVCVLRMNSKKES